MRYKFKGKGEGDGIENMKGEGTVSMKNDMAGVINTKGR